MTKRKKKQTTCGSAKQTPPAGRPMSHSERMRIAMVANFVMDHLGRELSLAEMNSFVLNPAEKQVCFMVPGHINTPTIFRGEIDGTNFAIAILPGMESIFGGKGLLIIGREYSTKPSDAEILRLVTNEWNINNFNASSMRFKLGA